MPRHKGLCFVIVDGGHARFVRSAFDNALHTFEAIDSASLHKKDHDLVSDRPGRAFESGTIARHAYTPRTDAHEMEQDRFTRTVATRLQEDAAARVFDEFVVVAPPHVMRELINALDAPTKAKLIGSLAKDLVNTPDHELWPHLMQWVGPVQRA